MPGGLTIGSDGMLYVSDCGNDRIVVFSKTNVFVRNIDVSASYSNNYAVFSCGDKLVRRHEVFKSTNVVVDAAGFAFAVHHPNDSNSLSSIFNAQGQVIRTIKLDHLWGVTIALNGSIWVTGCDYNTLWKF